MRHTRVDLDYSRQKHRTASSGTLPPPEREGQIYQNKTRQAGTPLWCETQLYYTCADQGMADQSWIDNRSGRRDFSKWEGEGWLLGVNSCPM
ncbi:hypothetical protein PoB_004113300 [Plakobranchus ocellatus]|uniref:Uncharacterized protein n=1 Tax=Plakobranchus ocellatus TaxID=259542 RepID=A0AAV4B697_9GAST|nr:hypothetical protein PoB_004113300 [Plakobranchus ocellatus]